MVLAEEHLPARQLATLPDRGRVILRDHKNIGTRNPEVRSIDHRNIAAGKRISETRRCVNNEGVQPVLAKRRDVIVQDPYPAARLRDVVADIEDPAHRRFFIVCRWAASRLPLQRPGKSTHQGDELSTSPNSEREQVEIDE